MTTHPAPWRHSGGGMSKARSAKIFEMQIGDQVRLVGAGAEFAVVVRVMDDGEFICEFPEVGFTCKRDLSDVVDVTRNGQVVYECELFADIAEAAAAAGRQFCRRFTEVTEEARRVYLQ